MPSGYKPLVVIPRLETSWQHLSQQRIDRIHQNMCLIKNFTVCIPNRQDWENNGIILNDDVVCFTDGSRFEQTGLSGAGVYNQTDGEEFILPLSRHTSVFQAEVYALLYCARLENLVNRNNSSVAICFDSLAAINAVSAFKATTGLVADAMKALKSLAIFNSVRLVWVPGHCGIKGNERVDLLAKQASSSCFTGPEPSVGISTSTIRSSISSWAIQEQSRLWQALPKCRQAKLFLNTPDWLALPWVLRRKTWGFLSDYLPVIPILMILIDTSKLWVSETKRYVPSANWWGGNFNPFHCSVQCYNATPKIYPRWLHTLTGHS